jgi:hypothetical protein
MRSGYGETVLFYDPEHLLPMGVYFASSKANDGPNDQASHLSREGVFRPTAASLGVIEPLPSESYARAQAGYRTRIARKRRSEGATC